MTKADDVCEKYAHHRLNLSLSGLSGDADDDAILISGSPISLRFLAELLVAEADDAGSDGFAIGPRSAGNRHFDRKSEFGLYIQRKD